MTDSAGPDKAKLLNTTPGNANFVAMLIIGVASIFAAGMVAQGFADDRHTQRTAKECQDQKGTLVYDFQLGRLTCHIDG